MEALVSTNQVELPKQSLDLRQLTIANDTDHYCYEEHPRICGISLWMKEKFRKKEIYIIVSIPISL